MAENAATLAPLDLNGAERDLCAAATEARPSSGCRGERIQAELIRRLLLSLPVDGRRYELTPFGIKLFDATITGRLELDNVVMESGAPIAALEFCRCVFEGGFSGANARFSRLCFADSSFRNLPLQRGRKRAPTIDLTSATLDSNLSLRGIRPARQRDHLWVTATGARIDGDIDLSRSQLRAPPARRKRLLSEPPEHALGLSLAEIKGDLALFNGVQVEGTVAGRRMIVRGDVWMSGALIESCEEALFLQSAEIGGLLMLDGRADDAAQRGDCRPFRAFGQVNLKDLQLGGSLYLANAQLNPPLPPPRRRRAETDGGADDAEAAIAPDPDFACLCLEEARIGDSVYIGSLSGERSRLNGRLLFTNIEIRDMLVVADCYLGVPRLSAGTTAEALAATVTLQAPLLVARQVYIANVEPLLWERHAGAEAPAEMKALSIDLRNAAIDTLSISESWINGAIFAGGIKCSGDVVVNAKVGRAVRLEGAQIGGSLDLSELRMDDRAEGLSLKDATIARALKLTRGELHGGERTIRLAKARRAVLASLGGMTLIECLWEQRDRGRPARLFESAFISCAGTPLLMDGKRATFDSMVGHFGHSITDEATAAEFVRLYGALVRDESGGRFVGSIDDLLPLYRPLAAIGLQRLVAARSGSVAGAPAGERQDGGAARTADGGGEDIIARLSADPDLLAIRAIAVGKQRYDVLACCLVGEALVRRRFRLESAAKPPRVRLIDEQPLDTVDFPPRFDRQFVRHHERVSSRRVPRWAMPQAADNMTDIEEGERTALEPRLTPYVRTNFVLRGTADLTGLSCDLLEDNSGRAWGEHAVIPMNHFVYRRTTWIDGDTKDPMLGIQFELLRRLPRRILQIKRLGLAERLRRSTIYCSGWQARLHWIFRQYDTRALPLPTHFPISQANYSPQPFEEAIRVCRAEGREDYALHFEIEKQKIEWRLRNRRSRKWFIALGLVAAIAWLLLTRPEAEHRWTVAFALLVGLSLLSYAANFALRFMFGYLRRPVRAIASLVAAFLIGWAGVDLANDRHLMIVDVEPVAALVAREGDGERILMVSETAASEKVVMHNVHCGNSISEPLYALDVLIPLIDLREESRCEVGRASDFGSQGPVRPAWVRLLLGRAAESERFWAAAKAIYAIAGWFLVSLSILTFVETNRPRAEPV